MVQSCLSPIYWNIKLASLKRKVYGDELTMYILVLQNNITLACDGRRVGISCTQTTRDIDPMLKKCCASGVATLVQHWVDVLCLLGRKYEPCLGRFYSISSFLLLVAVHVCSAQVAAKKWMKPKSRRRQPDKYPAELCRLKANNDNWSLEK